MSPSYVFIVSREASKMKTFTKIYNYIYGQYSLQANLHLCTRTTKDPKMQIELL